MRLLPSETNKFTKIAIFAAILWPFFYTLNMTFTKSISPSVPTYILLFWRSLFGVLLFLPFFLKSGIKKMKTQFLPLHIIRSILMTLAIFLTYSAYRKLPLTLATSIGFTAPLMMTILSMLLLKEQITWKKWMILLVGYMGVLVIVRPGIVPFNMFVGFALTANLVASFAAILVRILSQKDSIETIMMYAYLGMFVISSFIVALDWRPISFQDIGHIFCIAAVGAIAQYCYATAVKYAQASFVAPFEYLRIVFAIPIGFYAFNECIDNIMLIGASIIIGSTWILSRLNRKDIM